MERDATPPAASTITRSYESKDGGAYTLAATTTAPTFNKDLGPGHTYQFEVTATDNAGNTSAAKQGIVYKLSLFQENASAIKYSTPAGPGRRSPAPTAGRSTSPRWRGRRRR